jgi:exonuclease SbcC
MIKSLQITNFESHKDSKLEFCNGVNSIIGPTDVGKSTIINALNWVIYNKPGGDSFRSHWGGGTKTKIELENYIVTREKGKENKYCLGYKESSYNEAPKGDSYKAFGQGVPEDIKKALNFSDVNLQEQFDSPFLLSESSGEVAKFLNKIVHLDIIDTSIKNINKTLRDEESAIKILTDEIKQLKKNKKSYDWLTEAEGYLEALETEENLCLSKQKDLARLQTIIDKVKECETRLSKWKNIKEQKEGLNKCLELATKIRKREKKLNKIENQIKKIKNINSRIKEINKNLIINKKEFKKLMPEGEPCPLCEQIIEPCPNVFRE